MPLKEFLSYISQEKRTCCATKGHSRNTRFWFGGRQKQELGESLGQSLYWGFCGKGKAGQGKQLKIGNVNDYGRLWCMKLH